MQFPEKILFFIMFMLLQQYCWAQYANKQLLFGYIGYIETDSGVIEVKYQQGICKGYRLLSESLKDPVNTNSYIANAPEKKVKFLTIHGNVSYDYFFRSKSDTSLLKEDFEQHTERVWLNLLLKEKYAFRFGFTARQGNNSFMKDIYSPNLSFDKHAFTRYKKERALQRISKAKWENSDLQVYEDVIKNKEAELKKIRGIVNSPETLQKLIEEQERTFFKKQSAGKALTLPIAKENIIISNLDSLLNADKRKFPVKPEEKIPDLQPGDSNVIRSVNKNRQKLQEIESSLEVLKKKRDSIRTGIMKELADIRQSIRGATNPATLKKFEKEAGVEKDKQPELERLLENVQQVSVGRTLVDYTELTAKNVMLTGVNIEYGSSYYTAFAAGKIDYGFHDFFGRQTKQSRQHMAIGRIGWGMSKSPAVILSVFTGRKNNYPGFVAGDSLQNTINIIGYSVETIWKKDENTFLSAEIAKSITSRSLIVDSASKNPQLFTIGDSRNLGVNLKGALNVAASGTRLSGFFRKTGAYFQSFSLFTYQTNQQSWQIRADQSLLKNKIGITAMLRQNDFTNLLTQRTFKTSTVFKTLQLSVKIPKWPVLHAGYYPGSQFYMVDRNTILENAYYILNGSASYNYYVKGFLVNSSVIYNRYFNQATDSGFQYYKGINYILSQTIQLKKLQLLGSYSLNKQTGLQYNTWEAGSEYSLKNFLSLGVGIKYNQVKKGESYTGNYFKLNANLKKIVGLQLSFERSFLPTIENKLYPVKIGRVTVYKNF